MLSFGGMRFRQAAPQVDGLEKGSSIFINDTVWRPKNPQDDLVAEFANVLIGVEQSSRDATIKAKLGAYNGSMEGIRKGLRYKVPVGQLLVSSIALYLLC